MTADARVRAVALVLAAVAGACTDATDIDLLEVPDATVLFGQAYVDLDRSGSFTVVDSVLEEADVILSLPTGSREVARTTTDTLGMFQLDGITAGTYLLRVDPAFLGDSLFPFPATGSISVEAVDTTQVDVGVSFQELTIEELLLAPPGRKVFTAGIALNSRLNFGDGQVHFMGESAYLRGINVARSPLSPGDSVRVLGRTTIDNGRPALDMGIPTVLVPGAVLPQPEDMSTSEAANAGGGALDAALARIRNAEISDTSTNAEGHFRFWADDGTDSVEVVIRDFLGVSTTSFRPDTIVRIQEAVGLLSPYDDGTGSVRWRVLPRGGSDIVLQTKVADVRVSLQLSPTTASLGDTVLATIVASNAGPQRATQVQVRDTIPTALTFVSSSATTGSYAAGTGVWDIGDLAAGAADTLRVEMEVTDGTPQQITVLAESLGLVFEFEPNPGNDVSSVQLTIN